MVKKHAQKQPVVGLFVTCLVDLFRPSVGFAAVRLIEAAGYRVEVPGGQTCCGQPAYNSGAFDDTRSIARQVVEAFSEFDYVVAPSGSCAAMLKVHYPRLFENDADYEQRSSRLGEKTFELTQFLTEIGGIEAPGHTLDARVTYHDSCSGLRELGVKDAPRRLLGGLKGLELVEMADAEVCCGFGGTFCVKFADISNEMVTKKTASIAETRADILTAGDLGCLMNMAGKVKRDGLTVEVRHVAELLVADTGQPGIGDPEKEGS